METHTGMPYILAIDSGGSKCDAVLVREDGVVVGRGRCDVRHPDSGRGRGGSGRTAASVRQAVREAAGALPAQSRVLVVAHGRVPDDALPAERAGPVTLRGFGEAEGALALAGEAHGVVVLAGTGALLHAILPRAQELVLDGLGPLLGDYGSGFQIGLLAVRAAARSRWHARHATTLAAVIPEACAVLAGRPERFSLVEYMLSNPDRAEIASLAELVDREADRGDEVARAILEAAAGAMADTLRDAVDRLGIAHADLPLVGTGSVATRSRLYWGRLCALAAEFAPGLRPVISRHPAVMGAAVIGLRQIGAPPQALDRLLLSP